MASDPRLRAGDADRDVVAASLREAFAQGRITHVELEDRLDRMHAAQTIGELAVLTADLPAHAPELPGSQTPDAKGAKRRRDLRAGWASWLGVSLIVNVIWLASWVAGGESPGYYWPIWVMGPWGAAMALATLTQKARDDDS